MLLFSDEKIFILELLTNRKDNQVIGEIVADTTSKKRETIKSAYS